MIPLAVTVAVHLLAVILAHDFPPVAYLLLAVTYLAMGAWDLKVASLAHLGTILAVQGALILLGTTGAPDGTVRALALLLAASAVPLVVRHRIAHAATQQRNLIAHQCNARLRVGERLAKGCTPNPDAAALDPVASTESIAMGMLNLAKTAIHARTAGFYWYDDAAQTLVPVDVRSDIPDMLTAAPISLERGMLAPLRLAKAPIEKHYRPAEPQELPMYWDKVQASGFLAVPVVCRDALQGAFLFDRDSDDPFRLPRETVARLAGCLGSNLGNEKRLRSAVLLSNLMKRLNEFSRELAVVSSLEKVYEAILRHALEFVPFRNACLAHRVSTAGDEFEIVGVSRRDLASLVEQRFRLDDSLCGLAARSRTMLPANFTFEARMPQPFGPGVPVVIEAGDPCLVVPLVVREQNVGFLVFSQAQGKVHRHELGPVKLLGEFAAQALLNCESNCALRQLATRDSLTDLPNLRAFQSRLAEALHRSRRSGRALSLLLVDIDHFKSVNDTFGHAAGDSTLVRVARELTSSVRKVDFVARKGGEEFVVILENTDSSRALVFAERILQRMRHMPIPELPGRQAVTVSVGIASYPSDTDDPEQLIALADTALYRAKSEGRDCCRLS